MKTSNRENPLTKMGADNGEKQRLEEYSRKLEEYREELGKEQGRIEPFGRKKG